MDNKTQLFYSFVITSVLAAFLVIAKLCFKSKCDQIKIGCLQIHRNVDIETNDVNIN